MLKIKKMIYWVILLSTACVPGCTNMLDESKYADFDYDPYNYWKAEPTDSVKVPAHIAKNLKVQPLYQIPDKKLNGELKVKKVPPTLEGKIADFG